MTASTLSNVSLTPPHRPTTASRISRNKKTNDNNRGNVKGFGIGLYYTRKIIEKHLGSISLQANPGKTVFKINLTNE